MDGISLPYSLAGLPTPAELLGTNPDDFADRALAESAGTGGRDSVSLLSSLSTDLISIMSDTPKIGGRDAGPASQARDTKTEEILALPNPETMKKRELLESMLRDHSGSANTERLLSTLCLFPLYMIEKVKEHGVTIHILKDNPGEGDLKPTDLGFGHGDLEWNKVQGAYDVESHIMFYKEADLNIISNFTDACLRHEFSHPVDDAMRHDKDMGAAWAKGIDDNYDAAQKKEPGHKFVDGYAGKNKAEYLAQDVAAYLTNDDVPDDPSNDEATYYAHDNINRKNLQKKDPAIHDFLDGYFIHGQPPAGSPPAAPPVKPPEAPGAGEKQATS